MKHIFLAMVLFGVACSAQEMPESEWRIMPGISIVRHFSIGHRRDGFGVQSIMYPSPVMYGMQSGNEFSATGMSFSARFLNKDFEPLAFTLSAGANWYRSSDRMSDRPMNVFGGMPMPVMDSTRYPERSQFLFGGGRIGEREHFMSFPVGLGAQVLFPYDKLDKVMFFLGGEGTLHVLSRPIVGRQQIEAGFALTGGVAIKMVELGARYARFAGSGYIGVQAGIRFHQFSLD